MQHYFSTWNSPAQLFALLFKIGVPEFWIVYISNSLTIFLCLATIALPIYFFTRSIDISIIGSLLLNVNPLNLSNNILSVTVSQFESVYPYQRWDTEHTLGHYGLLTSLSVLNLILFNRLKIATLIAGLSISVHPIYGILNILMIARFAKVEKSSSSKSHHVSTTIFGLSLSFISYAFHLAQRSTFLDFENPDSKTLRTYIEIWDFHRRPNVDFRLSLLISQAAFSVLCLVLLRRIPKLLETQIYFFRLCIAISVGSSILYLGNTLESLFGTVTAFRLFQVSRLTLIPGYLLNSFLAGLAIVIITQVVQRMKEKHRFLRTITLDPKVWVYKKMFLILTSFFLAGLTTLGNLSVPFERKCEGLEKKLTLTTSTTTNIVLRECKLPILLDINSFDFISYESSNLIKLVDILEGPYGVKFSTLPEEFQHKGGLSDLAYRDTWEKRSAEDWQKVGSEFDVGLVIVPETWSLNLPILLKYNGLIVFKVSN